MPYVDYIEELSTTDSKCSYVNLHSITKEIDYDNKYRGKA